MLIQVFHLIYVGQKSVIYVRHSLIYNVIIAETQNHICVTIDLKQLHLFSNLDIIPFLVNV